MRCDPIGILPTPFTDSAGMPIQPVGARGVRGTIELLPEFTPGLADLGGFSHLILLYRFHRAAESRLTVTPFLDRRLHGVFATRAPRRPNPIGLSGAKLMDIDGSRL